VNAVSVCYSSSKTISICHVFEELLSNKDYIMILSYILLTRHEHTVLLSFLLYLLNVKRNSINTDLIVTRTGNPVPTRAEWQCLSSHSPPPPPPPANEYTIWRFPTRMLCKNKPIKSATLILHLNHVRPLLNAHHNRTHLPNFTDIFHKGRDELSVCLCYSYTFNTQSRINLPPHSN
jgi:hypothetical protein